MKLIIYARDNWPPNENKFKSSNKGRVHTHQSAYKDRKDIGILNRYDGGDVIVVMCNLYETLPTPNITYKSYPSHFSHISSFFLYDSILKIFSGFVCNYLLHY